MEKYVGSFASRQDVLNQFFDHEYGKDMIAPEDFPTEDEILFAAYGGGSYEGTATVFYRKDDKLYEVNGSHCSCYGLEDQWLPEETSVEAIKMREFDKYDYGDDEIKALKEFQDSL